TTSSLCLYLFLHCSCHRRDLHSFPTRRSSDLVADRRVVRLIQKWLRAGVLEDGKRVRTEEGTPQGGSASPLLANVYLHYVFDLWVQAWRQKRSEERRVGKEWRVGRETWE